jgi:hypothetical protein
VQTTVEVSLDPDQPSDSGRIRLAPGRRRSRPLISETGNRGCEGIPIKSGKVKNIDVSKKVQAHRDHLQVVSLR